MAKLTDHPIYVEIKTNIETLLKSITLDNQHLAQFKQHLVYYLSMFFIPTVMTEFFDKNIMLDRFLSTKRENLTPAFFAGVF
jgi:hypothetical protein